MDTQIENRTAEWLPLVNIREVRSSDLPALEWEGEYKHFRRVFADAYRRQERGLSVLWVAELLPVGLIGQVFIQLLSDRQDLADGAVSAYLYSFRVKPQYRNAGLGMRMMRVVESDLRRRNFKKITLNVAKDNLRARELYERAGYRLVGHEPGIWWYPDHHGKWRQVVEPAWKMEKTLSGGD
jgi:ribosomal protein S18 acetylase RimI-like enzyme